MTPEPQTFSLPAGGCTAPHRRVLVRPTSKPTAYNLGPLSRGHCPLQPPPPLSPPAHRRPPPSLTPYQPYYDPQPPGSREPPTIFQFCGQCWARGTHNPEDCPLYPPPAAHPPKPPGFDEESKALRKANQAQFTHAKREAKRKKAQALRDVGV